MRDAFPHHGRRVRQLGRRYAPQLSGLHWLDAKWLWRLRWLNLERRAARGPEGTIVVIELQAARPAQSATDTFERAPRAVHRTFDGATHLTANHRAVDVHRHESGRHHAHSIPADNEGVTSA